MKHSRRRLDLTGQRFGKLTVLAPAENVGRLTAWQPVHTGDAAGVVAPHGFGPEHLHTGAVHIGQAGPPALAQPLVFASFFVPIPFEVA